MFASAFLSLALLAASSFVLVVRADGPYPTAPVKDVYKSGSTCHIAWQGDKTSTIWKGMTIDLMTGDNYNMIRLMTVATSQDGTVDASFDHPCPEVTINAPIYFYQFSSTGASSPAWTTRFTIASATGKVVPAPNATQPPPGNNAIPWGVGAIAATESPTTPTNASITASSAVPSSTPETSNSATGSSDSATSTSDSAMSTSDSVMSTSNSATSTAPSTKPSSHKGHHGHDRHSQGVKTVTVTTTVVTTQTVTGTGEASTETGAKKLRMLSVISDSGRVINDVVKTSTLSPKSKSAASDSLVLDFRLAAALAAASAATITFLI